MLILEIGNNKKWVYFLFFILALWPLVPIAFNILPHWSLSKFMSVFPFPSLDSTQKTAEANPHHVHAFLFNTLPSPGLIFLGWENGLRRGAERERCLRIWR